MVRENAQPDQADLDKLVAAFVRIRGVDRLGGAIITRHWLASDMRVPVESLDGLLKLLRWQGFIELPDNHIVTVKDHVAMRAIALGLPLSDDAATDGRHDAVGRTEGTPQQQVEMTTAAIPVWARISTWH
jgi:hypothetical protein